MKATEQRHDFKLGDIIRYSWGYDQTNIDYFQVVAVTAKTVMIRELRQVRDHDNQTMTGHSRPLKDQFAGGEKLRKSPRLYGGEWYLSFNYGVGRKWSGEEMLYSSYA